MPPEVSTEPESPVGAALWAQAVESILGCLEPEQGATFLRLMAEGLIREGSGENVVELRSWRSPSVRRQAAMAFRQELPRFLKVVARD